MIHPCFPETNVSPTAAESSASSASRAKGSCDFFMGGRAEAGQRTDAHLTEPSTDRQTNGIRPKNTTASDRKIVQRADLVPCLGKKFSMISSDRIENSV